MMKAMIRVGVVMLSLALLGVLALQAEAGTIYVSPSGTNDAAARYNTWEGAAQDINAAVALAVANDEVVVTNGAYPVSTNLYVTNFTVRSVNGPAVTTVYRQQSASSYYAIFRLAHTNAFVSGFTITNGWWDAPGSAGGVYMTAGTVTNCVMTLCNRNGGSSYDNGVLYMSGGLVTDCILSNNSTRSWGIVVSGGRLENSVITKFSSGNDNAALVLSGGTARRCRIVSNTPGGNHPAVNMSSASARLENCLVWGNSASSYGGVRLQNGTMVNCTVASNMVVAGASASGVTRTGGTMTNCVVYGNQSGYANYSGAASAATYSCAPELTLGVQGNVTDNPRFVNLAAGDCRLSFGSSAVNSGTNTGLTVDLEGTNRDTQCDMGAYERVPPGGALAVAFSGLPQTGIGSVTSVFTAVLEGTDTNVTWWGWDFNNDGSFETNGAGLRTVTNVFAPGRHSISVWASNSVPQAASWTNLNYVAVQSTGTDVYVATNGANTFPYDTWPKAATNLTEAFGSAVHGGMTVWLSNGVYSVSAGMNLNTNIGVRSLNGPSVTTVFRPDSAGTAFAIFNLSHSNAFLSGLTITNGYWTAGNDCGGSVHMTAGTVTNCWIINTRYIGGTQSGAVYMNGGLMTACLISNSVPRSFALKLAGGTIEDSTIARNTDPYDESPVRVFGGTMRRCRVLENRSQGGTAVGPVWLSSGLIENCLIYGNVSYNNGAGGVGQGGGQILHCTIASNTAATASTAGAGLKRTSGTFTNCIIYGNAGANGTNYNGAASAAAYSCAPELTHGSQGNTTNNPLFKGLATGNCQLGTGSPCIDTGTNLVSVTNDLLRALRPQNGDSIGETNVDMGCYEMRDPGAGAFTVSFAGTPTYGFTPMQVVFTATLMGADTNVTWWGWDFDNNGTWDQAGSGLRVVTNTYYTPGTYTVMMRATNSSETAESSTNVNYLTAVNQYVYVSPGGSHFSPFTNWVTAATNINDAVAIATNGQTVLVTNGAYAVTTNLAVGAFSVKSVNGPAVTTVYRQQVTATQFAIFNLADNNAFVSGFTITNGQWTAGGAGGAVHMTAGTVSNCVMTRCINLNGTPNDNGVIYMNGGLMTECVISNNAPRSWGIKVAGGTLENSIITLFSSGNDDASLVLSGGTARRCKIVSNAPWGNHPAVNIAAATARLENCLVWGNTGSAYGGVRLQNGTMVNCTVASNMIVAGASAGGVTRTGGTMTNCIVYGNQSGYANYSGSASAAAYSCAPELTLGDQGNINTDPKFRNVAAGDCHLQGSSPCFNAGTNLASITVDLDGTSRDASCDMGAYEYDSTTGPMEIGFSGIPLSGIGSVTSVFTAVAVGSNTTITWYGWDFDNDGTFNLSGADLRVVTNVYSPGRYTVSLLASNAVSESSWLTNVNYVSVQSAGTDVYVSTNGSNTFPFETWAKATTNLNDAVANAARGGSTVWVSNGAYKVTGGLTLATNITVRSVNGPSVTLISRESAAGTGFPIFYLSQSGALVAGVTLSNGCWGVQSGAGGAVTMTAGLVTNCVMVGTVADSYNNGVLGLWGGTVAGCVISNNTPRSFTVYVTAGVMEDTIITGTTAGHDAAPLVMGYGPSGGTVRRCKIINNNPPGNIAGAVQIHGGARLENCLIWGNKAASSSYGAVLMGGGGNETRGGTMVNCTIASNSTVSGASGVTMLGGGTMTNCIVYGNDPAFVNYSGSASAAAFSCAPELTHGSQNNITNNPLFVDLSAGNGRLQDASPCINAGTNLPSLIGTVDLDGLRRVRNVVDMGAYERVPPGSAFRFR